MQEVREVRGDGLQTAWSRPRDAVGDGDGDGRWQMADGRWQMAAKPAGAQPTVNAALVHRQFAHLPGEICPACGDSAATE